MHGRGVCVQQGGMCGGGHAWQGECMALETATAASGTHPTGMHSCLLCICAQSNSRPTNFA